MKFLFLIVKNLTRNKRRTILTIVSISVSLFIFSALASLPAAVDRVLSRASSSRRLVVHNKAGLAYGLPPSYLPKIAVMPHVEAAVAQCWYGGIYHEVSDQFPNWALDLAGVEKVFSDWGVSQEAWDQFKKQRRACLVGPETMKRFHFSVGQQIMLRPAFPMYPSVQLEIVGTLGSKAPSNVLVFRRDYLEEAVKALNGETPFTDTMWVMPDSDAAQSRVGAEIDEFFANSSAETQTETEKSFFASFLETYRTIFNMAELLGAVVVITIGLVAANTAAMSIRERRSEIAVMRALGFPSKTILSLLLAESVLIALVGGTVGCAAAFVLLKGANLAAMGPLNVMRVSGLVLAEAMIIAAVIGLLSALVPAQSAARRSIVETLRQL